MAADSSDKSEEDILDWLTNYKKLEPKAAAPWRRPLPWDSVAPEATAPPQPGGFLDLRWDVVAKGTVAKGTDQSADEGKLILGSDNATEAFTNAIANANGILGATPYERLADAANIWRFGGGATRSRSVRYRTC